MSSTNVLPNAPLRDNDPALARRLVNEHGALLLDVRSPAEFAGGHLPGALCIPVDQLGARVGEVSDALGADLERPMVVYCRSGGRAGMAKQLLAQCGFARITNLGGIGDWDR